LSTFDNDKLQIILIGFVSAYRAVNHRFCQIFASGYRGARCGPDEKSAPPRMIVKGPKVILTDTRNCPGGTGKPFFFPGSRPAILALLFLLTPVRLN
jgi:hypothetical protein